MYFPDDPQGRTAFDHMGDFKATTACSHLRKKEGNEGSKERREGGGRGRRRNKKIDRKRRK